MSFYENVVEIDNLDFWKSNNVTLSIWTNFAIYFSVLEIKAAIEYAINEVGFSVNIFTGVDEENDLITCEVISNCFTELECIETAITRGVALEEIKRKVNMSYLAYSEDWKLESFNQAHGFKSIKV